MGEIIDTNQSLVFIIIMGFILGSIIISDTNKIMAKRNLAAAEVEAGRAEPGLSGLMRDIINNYWPTVFGIFGIILFIMVEKSEKIKGGYISLFVIIFMAVFFTSYTVFQWRTGSVSDTVGDSTETGCLDGVSFPQGTVDTAATDARCVLTAEGRALGLPGAGDRCHTASGNIADASTASADSAGACAVEMADDDGVVHQNICEFQAAASAGTSPGTAGRVPCQRHQNTCYIPTAARLAEFVGSSGSAIPSHTDRNVAIDPPAGCADADPVNGLCAECSPSHPSEMATGAPSTQECRFWLPGSNQFDMKEYKFFRFIYFFTLIILAACISNKLKSGNENIMYVIISMPFWVPIITEIVSGILDYTKDNTEGETLRTNARISPELLLIHFMRGDSAGMRPIASEDSRAGSTGGFATRNALQSPNWLSRKPNTPTAVSAGQPAYIDPFFSTHFFFTMIFYLLLMTLMIIHSQGLYGVQASSTPLFITLILMVGFPFFMTYIFVQDAAYDSINDEIPLPHMADQSSEMREKLQADRYGFWCKIEKYGGIQTMLCISLIIMILCKTNGQQNKAIALILIILLTYGFSQTLFDTRAY